MRSLLPSCVEWWLRGEDTFWEPHSQNRVKMVRVCVSSLIPKAQDDEDRINKKKGLDLRG